MKLSGIGDSKGTLEQVSDSHKKARILGCFGASIGGGVGGYFAAVKGNYIYSGVGAVLGWIMGNFIARLLGRSIALKQFSSIQSKGFLLLGFLSLLLAIAGIIGFFMTGKWEGIIGFIFFASCGAYFLFSRVVKANKSSQEAMPNSGVDTDASNTAAQATRRAVQ